MAISVYKGYMLEHAMDGQTFSLRHLVIFFRQKAIDLSQVLDAFLAGQGPRVGV